MTVKELINKLSEMNSDSEVRLVVFVEGNDYERDIECVMPDPYSNKGAVLIVSPVEI